MEMLPKGSTGLDWIARARGIKTTVCMWVGAYVHNEAMGWVDVSTFFPWSALYSLIGFIGVMPTGLINRSLTPLSLFLGLDEVVS